MKLLKDRQFENKAHIRIYMQLSVNEIHFSRGTFFICLFTVSYSSVLYLSVYMFHVL